MTTDLDWDDYDDWDPDDEDQDWDDDYRDDDGYLPDEVDYEIAKSYEDYWQHCEEKHGGGECHCRPSLPQRLAQWWWQTRFRPQYVTGRLRQAARQPWTVRLRGFEVTVRFRASHQCQACAGKGWFYTLSSAEQNPIPQGYNGAALCGCGSATARLADTRRALRRMRNEAPFLWTAPQRRRSAD